VTHSIKKAIVFLTKGFKKVDPAIDGDILQGYAVANVSQ
jgi:hypothetical protein